MFRKNKEARSRDFQDTVSDFIGWQVAFDILSSMEGEREEVYWSVCQLVKTRFEKDRTV